jgi:hypothetical protein
MGTIGNTGSYYSLSTLLSSGSGGSAALSGTSLATLLQSLISPGSGSASSANAYQLDLSPQAQQILAGGSAGQSSGSGASGSFVLTAAQQAAIKDIIAKFKDAPLDQNTFNQIQNALAAAGLSPQALAAEDQIKSFNPTNVLLEALGGNYSNIQTPSTTAAGEQAKETDYMQSVANLWKSYFSEGSSANGSSASGTAATGPDSGL